MSARITDAPVTPAQIRSIHVAVARHGIDDATYRAMLAERFDGATSSKDLTRRQASDLLASLGRPLPNPPGTRPPKTGARRRIRNPAEPRTPGDADGVVRLASGKQRELVAAMAAEIAWEAEDGFRRWLKRSLGIDRVRTADDARRAIQGLRGLKRHGHGKPEGAA